MTNLADATLDELRTALAPALAQNAAFDGWTTKAIDATADSLGVDRDVARLAFPDGAMAMIDAWFASIDTAMTGALPPETLAAMKIRARITALVEARLQALAPEREALRRALAILAMPQNVVAAGKLGWRSADAMWRAAGDTSTDFNFYTKRGILAGVYGSTAMRWFNDTSEDEKPTEEFLAARIENVMQFETLKAQMKTGFDRFAQAFAHGRKPG